MKTTIEMLKDAVDENGMAVDESALFQLIDTTLCALCCEHAAAIGGNDGCKPDI
ncbi:MAG TPA: hypothetical protein VNN08_15985 [Thermoanaerobaculia bacterium]|nr:hypothetical protein [Thermoanaerobaculia bacterium]